MSVYTSVEPEQLARFLSQYDLGDATEFVGIANGVENTNYFLATDQGRYVLTLFERHDKPDLDFFLGLAQTLADRGLPCPKPLLDRQGRYLNRLNGKYAAIVQRLSGVAPVHPNASQCQAVGDVLGRIHTQGIHFNGVREDGRGQGWRRTVAAAVAGHLTRQDAKLLWEEVRYQELNQPSLPRGIIHADLFRDNTLFLGHQLSGVIDFYLACRGDLLYDLAICVNDWCIHADGALAPALTQAMLTAYHAQRPLTPAEQPAWLLMLRRAALRFWLSRLHDLHYPRDGEMTHTKDPDHFKNILLLRIEQPRIGATYWPE